MNCDNEDRRGIGCWTAFVLKNFYFSRKQIPEDTLHDILGQMSRHFRKDRSDLVSDEDFCLQSATSERMAFSCCYNAVAGADPRLALSRGFMIAPGRV